MGKSFFTGTDAAVFTGSAAFSSRISAAPAAYGLVPEQAAAYAALHDAYAAAYVSARDPQTRTRGKVQAKNDAKAALRRMASALARIIDGTADVSDARKLELGLSVRQRPAPLPPPGAPDRFRLSLSADGALELRWTCHNPAGSRGTIYQVWRRISAGSAGGGLEFLGDTGKRRFTDRTLPAGASGVMYQVRAMRSTKVGPWAQFNVSFGAGGAGGASAGMPKMAA